MVAATSGRSNSIGRCRTRCARRSALADPGAASGVTIRPETPADAAAVRRASMPRSRPRRIRPHRRRSEQRPLAAGAGARRRGCGGTIVGQSMTSGQTWSTTTATSRSWPSGRSPSRPTSRAGHRRRAHAGGARAATDGWLAGHRSSRATPRTTRASGSSRPRPLGIRPQGPWSDEHWMALRRRPPGRRRDPRHAPLPGRVGID